jgi:heme/copper-type cytochrome/quinol oxidase subunit 2
MSMSAPLPPASPAAEQEADVVESIAYIAPIVLPIVGGVLMFLLAFIAVFMA